MTSWCDCCQQRHATPGTTFCEPCRHAIRRHSARHVEDLRVRIESTALELNRLLKAYQAKRSDVSDPLTAR